MKERSFGLAQQLGSALAVRQWQVTTAESCTGGGVAAAITDVAGSSGWFNGGFVTYSNTMKTKLLGVDCALIDAQGAVSEAVVLAMLVGALDATKADIGVAVSGIAGPAGGAKDKPVGTVCFAVGSRESSVAETAHFDGDRSEVRRQSVVHALRLLLNSCKNTV